MRTAGRARRGTRATTACRWREPGSLTFTVDGDVVLSRVKILGRAVRSVLKENLSYG